MCGGPKVLEWGPRTGKRSARGVAGYKEHVHVGWKSLQEVFVRQLKRMN